MGFFRRTRARFALLFALCIFVAIFAVPASAQEEYQITATLQAPEPEEGAGFGSSVAVSGDVVAVGEPLADVEDKSDAGRAYIFDSSGNLLSTLQSPTPQEGAEFGGSHTWYYTILCLLAVSGDIVVIGERGADVEGVSDAGRAYIIRAGGKTLTPSPTPTPTADYAPYLMAAAVIVVVIAASLIAVRRKKD